MRKLNLIILLLGLLFIVPTVTAGEEQETFVEKKGKEIFDSFVKKNNIGKSSYKNGDIVFEFDFELNFGDATIPMPLSTQGEQQNEIANKFMSEMFSKPMIGTSKVYIKKLGDKVRVEMLYNNDSILFLLNNDIGILKVKKYDYKYVMPKFMADAVFSQKGIIEQFSYDINDWRYKYNFIDEEDQQFLVLQRDVSSNFPTEKIYYFSSHSGLLDRMSEPDVTGSGQGTETYYSEYKQFGDVMLPTKIEVLMGGHRFVLVNIKSLDVDQILGDGLFEMQD